MDSIQLNCIGIFFEKTAVFKNINFPFLKGSKYYVLGRNGSGKSTLIKIIAGILEPNTGEVTYFNGKTPIDPSCIFTHLAVAAPYLNLFEELTLEEHVYFHFSFKNTLKNMRISSVLEKIDLPSHRHKRVASFSSGMKQKVKLALAILSDTPVLLLDEPCSNLDQKNTDWYQNMITQYTNNRIVIVASNHDEREMGFCTDGINLS